MIPIQSVYAEILDIKDVEDYYSPVNDMTDFAYNGSHFWVPDQANNEILVLNIIFSVQDSFEIPGVRITRPFGITFNETHAFFGQGDNSLFAMDLNTKNVTRLPETPSVSDGFLLCLHYLNGELYASFVKQGANIIKVLSPNTGETLRNLVPGLKTPYGITSDENDSLWISDYDSSTVIRIDPTTEHSDVAPPPHERQFYTPDYPELPQGMAYNGFFLWILVGDYVYKCDPVGVPLPVEGFPFHLFLPLLTIGGIMAVVILGVSALRKR